MKMNERTLFPGDVRSLATSGIIIEGNSLEYMYTSTPAQQSQ